MANLRLVDHYIPGIAGGCCYFCRTSQRHDNGTPEAVVATSVELSEGGEIALCGSCVSEMASLLGLVAGDVLEAARAETDKAKDELADLDTLLANAEFRASDAEAALRTVVALTPAASVVPAEPTDPSPGPTTDDPSPLATTDDKPARKARSTK